MAAPVELTVTTFGHCATSGVEPSTTAHQFAPVDGLRCLIAKSPLGAEGPGAVVGFTEVRRRGEVDEVGLRLWFVLIVLCNQFAPRPSDPSLLHLCCSVKLVLKDGADVTE